MGLLATLFTAAVLVLGWAPRAHAQAVSYTADTFVTIGATQYVIESGSAATSVVNTATTLTVIIPAASTFTLSSLEGYSLGDDAGVTDTCSGGTSSAAVSGAATVIYTPNTAVASCTSGGGSSGGGGGGGGGSSSDDDDDEDDEADTDDEDAADDDSSSTPSSTPSAEVSAKVSALVEQVKSLVAILESRGVVISAEIKTLLNTLSAPATSGTFTSDLDVGASGTDVSSLQNWLIKKGYSIPAGATGFYGAQTKAAVAAYQAANGISPASGFFGPKTRAYVGSHP
jgi:hypothetical protein